MVFRRASGVVILALLVVASANAVAQDKRQEEKRKEEVKLSKPQLEQLEALSSLVDAVMTGKEPAPADVKLKIQQHFVKSTTNVFIPYIAEVSGGTFNSFPVAVYVRAVPKSTKTLAAKGADYPFADLYFLEAKSLRSTGADSAEFSRGLQLPAGDFDVYVAIMETQAKNSKAPPKRVVHTHALTVPDLAAGLTTSSIILAKSMEDAPAMLTPQQQLEQPFTIGGNKITPTFTPAFAKSGELLFVFFIYNQGTAASGKPDVDVNYLFYRASEAKPFSKAATTSFNATTLPAEFSSSAGHQLVVGQGIPLASFAPGDYKLEVTIADKTSNQTIMRDVPFTVTN
jgi:hypothetical protein